MWRFISLCSTFLFLSAAFAQISPADKSLRVLENETRVVLAEKEARVLLAVENPADEFTVNIKLEILAPNDFVHAQTEITQKINRGKQNPAIPMSLEKAVLNDNALLWYRLRYEITPENAPDSPISGIVSFSQILPEVFELRSAANYAYGEKLYRLRVQAVNPANQNAVADVRIAGEIIIENRAEPIKAVSKTNAEGFAVLEFDLPDFKRNDDLDLRITGSKNGLTREIESRLEGLADKFAELTTDKPLYQPAQTVNLRLYYYNQNFRPVKDAELTIEIENEDEDELVFTETVKTSRFGIAAAAWKIPDGARLGTYQISVKNSEDDRIEFERIKITRYDLPNFYVEARPDRKFYLPDQTGAKIEINAKYLFGKPLTQGKVRITANERDDGLFKEITGDLNADGAFSAELDLTKAFADFDEREREQFRDLRLAAFITDPTTNRSESRAFDVRLTREPIQVYLIGETYDVSSRLPIKFYVSTFYADGTPAVCDVGVYENIEKDLDGKPVTPELGANLAKTKTNDFGAGKLKLPVMPETDRGDINIKIIAVDAKGLAGSLTRGIDTADKAALAVETDKVAYRKGEPSRVSIVSSEQKGLVFVDVISNSQILYATAVKLERGRAELTVPYREDFKNTVEIAAYFEDENENLIVGTKRIIYPTPTNLEIEADTQKEIFRPGEEVSVKFRSRDGSKNFAETALGVLVLDRAVEERARTESETSNENSFLNRTFTSRLAALFGRETVFGNLTVSDVKNLNLAKPLAPDFALALEIALGSGYYRPQIKRSSAFRDDLDKLFTPLFRQKMKPLADALDQIYREKQLFPTDERSLREMLAAQKIDFGALRDAWGNEFRTEFRVDRDFLKLEIWSPGADKLPQTADDLTVLESNRKYFAQIGRAIDNAMRDFTQTTNGFITDYQTLRDAMRNQNIDLDALRDPWGNPYRFEFSVDRINYLLLVKSNGADGQPDKLGNFQTDDFTLWTNRADYFTVTKANLMKGFNDFVEKNKTFPRNEAEMADILLKSGFSINETKDVFGRTYYIQQKATAKLANFYRYKEQNLKVVKQKILTFAVRSAGLDGIRGNFDDFELANFSGAVSEEEIDLPADVSLQRMIVRQKAVTAQNGAIAGMVFDQHGAVIPGAVAKVTNASRTLSRTVASNENGEFLIGNLPKDVYSLEVSAVGFKSLIIANLTVEPDVLIEIDAMLEVGSVSSVVEVSSGVEMSVSTSEASISTVTTAGKIRSSDSGIAPSFTPRVRDYFAETLLWSPELVTDKKGKAELKFKMADSLTTWKMYVIGSDEAGNFGVVEKELQTFQPFFAELEPPRVLTEGDEIALSVPVRNYTDKRRQVEVSLAPNNWSQILGKAAQNIEIPANASVNAIFNFRAATPIIDGKQRITALAKKDSDAIEKPVTVRPNGKESVETQSKLFEKDAGFEVNFQSNAFPNTRRAEIKIYPNMFAHVAESVEGLLKRPYGCGEQTISSTYPNLLILKIEKELGKSVEPRLKAQAREFLEEGYKRLLNYQTDTGFGYWNGNDPDIALTAYVLRFLRDAEDFIETDNARIEKAEKWLLSQQQPDGSWETLRGNRDVSTAYVLRSLTLTAGTDTAKLNALQSGIEFLKKRLPETDDAFVLANLALIALEKDDPETAQTALEKLKNLAQTDKESVYWTTPTTPFSGWGNASNIETTALVVQAFFRSQVSSPKPQVEDFISRGLAFLLKNKDRYGVWYSTQTTVNVLDALIGIQEFKRSNSDSKDEKSEIFVNGRKVREFAPGGNDMRKPFVFDASEFLTSDNNRVEIKTSGTLNLTMAQIVATHYISWTQAKADSRYFDLQVDFDKTGARIGDEITCRVFAQRKTNRGGMALAEIGLPPGTDVDRPSLEKAKREDRFSSYDILPDRIVIYFWTQTAPLDFTFKFRPRFGLKAQTAPSVVYDYYNEEASATIAPVKFEIK